MCMDSQTSICIGFSLTFFWFKGSSAVCSQITELIGIQNVSRAQKLALCAWILSASSFLQLHSCRVDIHSFNYCFSLSVATLQNLLAVDENKGNAELWIVHTLCTTTWMLGSRVNNSHHSLESIFKDTSFRRFLGSHPQYNRQSFRLEPGSRTLPSLCFSQSENQAVIIVTFQI